MKPAARWSILAALCVLALIGVLVGDGGREMSETSFGAVPPASGALFDLLAELEFPVARSYARPETLPPAGTVWWIAPSSVCSRQVATEEGPPERGQDEWRGREWIEAGGTALVLLPTRHGAACQNVAGVALPERTTPLPTRPSAQGDAETSDNAGPQPKTEKDWPETAAEIDQAVSGRVGDGRRLRTRGLATFKSADSWDVAARLDGEPFLLEHGLGRGRLIVMADAAFLHNAWLDRADNAPFAVDLVRAYGPPRFDERDHGLRAQDSAVLYLATSAALPLFVGLTIIGLLFVWKGRTLPPRRLVEDDVAAPTIETFVESLAAMYATTKDFTRVAEQYREVTAARLRRHFGLPPETSRQALLERLRMRRLDASVLASLVDAQRVDGEAQLRTVVRRLDLLAWEATR